MNADKVFFDTNVLLYMYGGADPDKQRQAKELFHQCTGSGRMLLSTQVVQEVYAAGRRKLGMPLGQLRDIAAGLLDLPLVTVRPSHILSAMQTEERYGISFWDALILAAAESGGAGVLYTEDLNDGQKYGTVLVTNPFRTEGQSQPLST
ncbi:MAG TPA: PIN domain-containing protein [Candidatus Acidoferrales bacterium]|jgi:predicted nucleic acid-binding protein|nr:PIN domain-containing protein [Candidatus Acidoferrales bacterium]